MKKDHTREFLAELYRQLYTIRIFEERGVRLYAEGLIRGYFHPCTGQEAVAVGVCAALREGDLIASTHRGHGHCIAMGGDLKRMTAELMGRSDGYSKGLGGSMHIADFERGNLGANGIVGGGIPIGAGAALAQSIREDGGVTVVFTSDGATNNGVFAETLNLAAIWNAPLLMVVENNRYAVNMPVEESTREPNIFRRGAGYGVESMQVDGNDVCAVYEASCESAEICRDGRGPVLLEALTFRFGGHHVNDPGAYMPKDLMDIWKERDPLRIGRTTLVRAGMNEEDVRAIERDAERVMDEAVAFAKKSPEMSLDEFDTLIREAW